MATNSDKSEKAPKQASNAGQMDDFDRVGTEISIMLRHAQESASKIRGDAEVEAQALVEQVRADLEADRIAHDQAAAELVARTEETANTLRVDAETFATETRAEAEQHAATRKQEVEAELVQVVSDTHADRQRAADELEGASAKAEQTVADANKQAQAIIAQANADAATRSKEMIAQAQADARASGEAVIGQAREALQQLVAIETRSREELEKTRESIKTVLDQMTITQIESQGLPKNGKASAK